MAEIEFDLEDGNPPLRVDLRNPYRAALLAWLWPGAGHFYQRRFAKGYLFMICVLTTFAIGMGIGRARVVYASLDPNDFRWQYVCQLGVGLPALPALVQMAKTRNGGEPLFVMAERVPANVNANAANAFIDLKLRPFEQIPPGTKIPPGVKTLKDGFMAPPAGKVTLERDDVLGAWHAELKHWFEIGTVYTLVAGLLNLLAVYDAFTGPMIMTPAERRKLEGKRKRQPQSEVNS